MPIVVITGTSRGIGLEFTKQYAAAGWSVLACCRRPDTADELRGFQTDVPEVTIKTLDVADEQSIAHLADYLGDSPVDLLINNAGASEVGDHSRAFGNVRSQSWADLFAVNTIGPILLTQAIRQNLVKSQDPKVVMISSIRGSIEEASANANIAYASSKAGLNMAMRLTAFSLKSDGITVVSLHPGWVRTATGGANAPSTPAKSVGTMRQTILNLQLSDSSKFFNYDGQVIPW